ncbi:MAG TPA: hypothetical protein VK599_23725, partial [Streptosporangiaceae bacterium]|nr:hypothetical protein [Streptosporangiaceae bacterium]
AEPGAAEPGAVELGGREPGGREPGAAGSGVAESREPGSSVVGAASRGGPGASDGRGRGTGAGTGSEAWSEAGLRRLLAAGAGAVATMRGDVVEVLTATGQWRARLPGSPPMSRDALVAGLVPGVALGWSWPESLQHAVSLAASAAPAGDPDLVAYEQLLPQVIIESR